MSLGGGSCFRFRFCQLTQLTDRQDCSKLSSHLTTTFHYEKSKSTDRDGIPNQRAHVSAYCRRSIELPFTGHRRRTQHPGQHTATTTSTPSTPQHQYEYFYRHHDPTTARCDLRRWRGRRSSSRASLEARQTPNCLTRKIPRP